MALKKDNATKNEENHCILKKIMNLALIPHWLIRNAFDDIKDEVSQLKMNTDMRNKWELFFEYFENQWMIKTKPEYFSVFDMYDRTNNYLESYHRTLNSILRAKPSTLKFLSKC